MSPSVYFRRFEGEIFLNFEKEDHVKKFLKYINYHHQNIRKSRPEVFCEKGVLRNFAKFTGKHLCQGLFFNKVVGGASGGCFSNIKFVFVEEHNEKIAFLVISIARVENGLQISLLQKKKTTTTSGVYLNFNRHLPPEYKNGLLHTLL